MPSMATPKFVLDFWAMILLLSQPCMSIIITITHSHVRYYTHFIVLTVSLNMQIFTKIFECNFIHKFLTPNFSKRMAYAAQWKLCVVQRWIVWESRSWQIKAFARCIRASIRNRDSRRRSEISAKKSTRKNNYSITANTEIKKAQGWCQCVRSISR